jgi:PAS domain S-box-containing protein
MSENFPERHIEAYLSFFQNAPNPILVVDQQHRYINGNQAALTFLELNSIGELRSKTIWDFMQPKTDPEKLAILQKYEKWWQTGGQMDSFYLVNQKIKILDLQIQPMLWQGEKVLVGFGRDVTQGSQEKKIASVLLELHKKAWTMSEDELFEYIMDTAVSVTESVIGFILEITPDQQAILFKKWNKETWKFCKVNIPDKYPLKNAGNWADCVRERRAIVYNDYETSPNKKGLPPGHPPIFRIMTIPVVENHIVKYVIGVGNKPTRYQKENIDQLQLIANEMEKIISQHRIENVLRESDERFRMLFEHAPLAYQSLDKNGCILEANRAWLELFGYTRAEVIGKWFGDFLAPEYIDGFNERYPLFLTQGCAHNEFVMIHKTGKRIDICIEGRIGRTVNGQFKQTHCILQDETERKQAEAKLQENLKYLQSILNTTQDGFWVVDTTGKIVDVNDVYLKFSGYTRDEFLRLNIHDIEHDEKPEETKAHMLNIIEHGHDCFQTHHRKKDGSIFDVEVSASYLGKEQNKVIAFCKDITVQQINIKSLKENELKYRSLSEELDRNQQLLHLSQRMANIGSFEYNFETDSIRFSDQMYSILSIPKNTPLMFPQLVEGMIKPADLTEIGKLCFHTRNDELQQGFEFQIYPSAKPSKWVKMQLILTKGPDGFPNLVSGVLQDIDDGKRKELQLKQSEEKYRELVMNANSIIMKIDKDYRITYANEFAINYFGFSEAELIGNSVLETIVPEKESTGRDLNKMVRDVFQYPEGYESNINENIKKNGERVWIAWANKRMYDEQGNFTGLLTIGSDITKTVRAELRLQESEERFRTLAEQSIVGLFVLKNDWFVFANQGMGEIIGVPPQEILKWEKRDFIALVHGEDQLSLIRTFEQILIESKQIVEVRLLTKASKEKFLRMFLKRIEIQGQIFIQVVLVDISDLKRAEAQLKTSEQKLTETNTKLQSINQDLEGFIHSASHDLQAPLRRIDGFSQAIMDDYFSNLPDLAKDYFKRIRNGIQQMFEILDGLLRLSRVQRATLNYVSIDLSDLVTEIGKQIIDQDPKRHVDLKIKPNIQIKADLPLIRIVLENLLSNAWKFTSKNPNAEIEFGTTIQDQKVVYYIKDNGVGFDQKYVDKIFGLFTRLHDSQEFKGTGIGLATVKKIIELHHGQIWTEGKVNDGATFYFTLP